MDDGSARHRRTARPFGDVFRTPCWFQFGGLVGGTSSGGVRMLPRYAHLRLRLTAAYAKTPDTQTNALFQGVKNPTARRYICSPAHLRLRLTAAYARPRQEASGCYLEWSTPDATPTLLCSILTCRRVMNKACRLMDSRRGARPPLDGSTGLVHLWTGTIVYTWSAAGSILILSYALQNQSRPGSDC